MEPETLCQEKVNHPEPVHEIETTSLAFAFLNELRADLNPRTLEYVARKKQYSIEPSENEE